MEEEEKDTMENPTPSQIHQIENGIFNMVISLCQYLSVENPPENARKYVASYLERIAAGLKDLESNTTQGENE